MNRNLKIGLIVGGSIGLIGVISYFLYKRKKEKETPKSIKQIEDTAKEEIIEEIKTETNSSPEEAKIKVEELEKNPNIVELKKDLAKGYDIFSNEQFVMCPTSTAQIINCKNKEPFSLGATQGTWILLSRNFIRYKDKFYKNEKDNFVKEYGQKLINSLQKEFNRVYKPQYYNTTTNWYSEYLKKGGTPIPS